MFRHVASIDDARWSEQLMVWVNCSLGADSHLTSAVAERVSRVALRWYACVDNLLIGHGIEFNGWRLRTVSRHALR